MPFRKLAEQTTALVNSSYAVGTLGRHFRGVLFTRWQSNPRARELSQLNENQPILLVQKQKQKSIKKPTGWNSFMQSVAVSLFCISRNIQSFSAWIKCLFILYIRLQVIKIKSSEISVKNKLHVKFSFMSLTNMLSISVALIFVILVGLEITFDIS